MNLGAIPGVRRFHRFLYRKFRPKGIATARVHGDMLLSFNAADEGEGMDLLLSGEFSGLLSEQFSKFVRPGMIVADIGAHIGFFTLLFSKLVGPTGRVFAFEPEPRNLELLRQNVSHNQCGNVSIRPFALGRTSGEQKLYLDRRNFGNMSLASENITPSDREGEVAVSVKSLDAELAGAPLDFLKLDVQGAEGLVLAGARETLRERRPVILMEFWPYGLKNLGTEPREFLSELANFGYEFFVVHEGKGKLQAATVEGLLGISRNRPGGRGWTNILCTPRGGTLHGA